MCCDNQHVVPQNRHHDTVLCCNQKLKARIKESTVRSWSICHGKDLADAGGNFKHSTPRDADDVVQRAVILYVECMK